MEGLVAQLRASRRRCARDTRRPMTPLVPPVAALAVILILDAVETSRHWPVLVLGLLDEPAHVLTAWLFLAALLPGRLGHLRPWALGGAVVIDVDHVPLYLWGIGSASPSGRPVTHSLFLAATLLALALPGRRLRTPLCGLALGVLLHLVRDVATGPGVPLVWPAQKASVLAPYASYLTVLFLVSAVALCRGYDGDQRRRNLSRSSSRRWNPAHEHSAQSVPRR